VAHGPTHAGDGHGDQVGHEVGFLGRECLHVPVVQPSDNGLDLAAGKQPFGVGLGAHRQIPQAHRQCPQPLRRPTGHLGMGLQARHEGGRGVAGPDPVGLEHSGGFHDAGVQPVAQGERLLQVVAIRCDFELLDCRGQVRQHARHRTHVRPAAQGQFSK
jgi:hypothetical protein